MALSLNSNVRTSVIDAIRAHLDAGSGPAYIQLRSGTRPANVGTAATGTLLATLTLNDPAYNAAATGTAALNTGTAITAVAALTGTASWVRVFDSAGVAVFDAGVGTSGQEFILNSVSIVSGGTVTLTAGSLTIAA